MCAIFIEFRNHKKIKKPELHETQTNSTEMYHITVQNFEIFKLCSLSEVMRNEQET